MEVNLKYLEESDIDTFPCKFRYETFKSDMRYSIACENRDVMLVKLDDKPLMIMGVNYLQPGMGDLWLIAAENSDLFPIQFVKITKTIIDGCLFAERKMRRLQFYVKNTWKQGHKWAKILGFYQEGIAQAYGADFEDYACYAKVRGIMWA